MKNTGARRWWALGAISLALLAIGLDQTVLNLALPTLSTSLHASESELQWFVTAYTLALAAAMLPAGLLGDRYGRKTLLVTALVLFGAASVACAYSPSAGTFIAARAVLGLAGAAIIVMSLSVVTVLFSEEERPRAIGIWSAANFLALPLGPIVGGYILAHLWWGWVFLMNVPVTLLGLAAVVALVAPSKSAERRSFDFVGIVSSSAGLVALMYGLVQAGEQGWGDMAAIGPVAVGLAILALFVAWESRLGRRPGGQPLVDLALFRSRSFTWGVTLTALGVFGLFGVLFTLPQYLQAIQGLDAQGAGLRFLPAIAGLVVGAISADRVANRLGAKATVAIGFVVLAVGMIVGSTTAVSSQDPFIAAWTFIVGAGAGLGFATAASSAVVELSAERSGVGSGLLQTVVKLGPAFGATILGSVLNATYQSRLDVTGLPADAAAAVEKSVFGGLAVAQQLGSPALLDSVRAAFVAGMDDASRLAAGVAFVAVILGIAFLPGRDRAAETAAQGGELLRDLAPRN